MTSDLYITPLTVAHLDELASVLLHPQVYACIEDSLPTHDEFILGYTRALRGPKPTSGQQWFNYLMRDKKSGAMIGRLEATVHDDIAEVAFLLSPTEWGKGYASAGLKWPQNAISCEYTIDNFWATTVPENTRCQQLLRDNGSALADANIPMLLSYAAGDLVFQRVGASVTRGEK